MNIDDIRAQFPTLSSLQLHLFLDDAKQRIEQSFNESYVSEQKLLIAEIEKELHNRVIN